MDFSTVEGLLRQVNHPQTSQRKAIRFLLVSTHAQQTTGYSKVSYHICQELAKQKDIQLFHFGFQRFFEMGTQYRPYPEGVEVYDPAGAEKKDTSLPRETGFGYSQLPTYIRQVEPDIVMIYNDASVICQFLQKMTEQLTSDERRAYKLIVYLDQVYTIQRPDLLARIDQEADVYVAFTDFWRDVLKRQLPTTTTKPIYVFRHGFDADMYKPMDRMAVRRKHGLPENLFLMVNFNRNTPRKRYDIVVTALAELVARYPTKPIALLCVCDAGEQGGYPIHEIYTRELIKRGVSVEHHINKLLITKTALNYTDQTVNEIYCMADIGITAAEGEGFGLCQFEAMGCGVPQVVPDVGGFKDFCRPDNAVLVKPTYHSYLPFAYSPIGGHIEVVAPSDVCLGIEEYLLDSELREAKGKVARETVLAYRWSDEIAELTRVIRTLV